MGLSPSIMGPQELVKFRKLNTSIENVDIPRRAENRSLTDRRGFLIYGVALLILLPFLINSNIGYFSYGTDSCGNFCGWRNEEVPGIACSGADYTGSPYSDEGVYVEVKVVEEFGRKWWKYLLTIFITIALAIVALILLMHTPAYLIWGVVILSMLALVLITLGIWILCVDGVLFLALYWTVIAATVLIVFINMSKKIGLVIQLYKETITVLAAMPMIVFVPILFAVFQIIILILGCATILFIVSYDLYTNGANGVMRLAILYHLVILSWTMRIVAGIQFTIISGSASTWYFSNNKDYLDSPIFTNFKITLKYHLGTIAFGSFLMTLFSVVKAILRATLRNVYCRCFFVICCNNAEIVLKFFSEHSYIHTGIRGHPFLRSAKRAIKLLITNASTLIAINCVGDFVLGIIIFLISVIATAISYALFSDMGALAITPTAICFVVNLVIVLTVFSSFSTIVDTLFICFCEDSVLNDGISRPYVMSKGLMEFVENSKKVYGKNGR